MPYVITDACVKDFLCADQCAVDAISPKSEDANAGSVEQVFINPDTCIECGSCTAVCEHNAIYAVDDLPADKAQFTEKNAAFFQ